MNRMFPAIIFAITMALLGNTALAVEQGTLDEATALVKKAVTFAKANGKEKVIAEANNPKGQFVDRDLYVNIYELNTGIVRAYVVNTKLLGKDVSELKDADGKSFIRDILNIAKKDGKGTVDYKWLEPSTKAIMPKVVYLERWEDLVFTSGSYKK